MGPPQTGAFGAMLFFLLIHDACNSHAQRDEGHQPTARSPKSTAGIGMLNKWNTSGRGHTGKYGKRGPVNFGRACPICASF